jgi:hypothetical protein
MGRITMTINRMTGDNEKIMHDSTRDRSVVMPKLMSVSKYTATG